MTPTSSDKFEDYKWLDLQCPDCGVLYLPELVLPDFNCNRKQCKTHPVVRPRIILQLELARRWEETYGRSANPAPARTA